MSKGKATAMLAACPVQHRATCEKSFAGQTEATKESASDIVTKLLAANIPWAKILAALPGIVAAIASQNWGAVAAIVIGLITTP